MTLKRITEKPTIADTILFDIECPDENGCFKVDEPYKVSQISIYYLSRSFVSDNFGEYNVQTISDETLLNKYKAAKKLACDSPTEENLLSLSELQTEIDLNTRLDKVYYNDVVLVATFGSDDFPAWIASDLDNAFITKIDETKNGDPLYGHFELRWEPKGMREGDYFICWSWTPLPASEVVTAHEYFTLYGSTQLTTSIPTHFTVPGKYELLQERYLPEMFKSFISNGDVTPPVLRGFNNAVGDGFTFLEDMASQIVDTIDANATHESYLIPLANLFNLKLRTSDPTMWRRQIKNSIPLFKKKGTLNGLKEALSQSNVDLIKLTKLWQVISPYTWQESFDIEDQTEFNLEKVAILPINVNNFELYYRGVNDSAWTTLTPDYVSLSTSGGITTMTWVGDNLSMYPISLNQDDSIRVIYQTNPVPDSAAQTIENYIRNLPLMDLRDERNQIYPPKNWNVRAIEEDDAFFDIIIPTKHPYCDLIIWGWIRTEFPYSENIYNMEEYNGSLRESLDPCDIDKDFIDPCKGCQTSAYVVNLDIGDLSDDRLVEVYEVIKEYTPFHSVLHSINIGGKIEDFIQPKDDFWVFLNIRGEDVTLSGNGQLIFNRVMTSNSQARRDSLASMISIPDDITKNGTGTNQIIQIYSPNVTFDAIGLDTVNNVLEILTGSNAGTYSITNPDRDLAEITGILEPFSASAFTFRLSNEILVGVNAGIYQDDIFEFTDEDHNFYEFDIKTLWDNNISPSIIPWQIDITSPPSAVGTFAIENILPNDTLIIHDPASILPNTNVSNITYSLLDSNGEAILSGVHGAIGIKRRGRVDISSLVSIDDIKNIVDIGNYLQYLTTQYKVSGYVSGQTHEFYIDGYADGDAVGVNVDVYNRLSHNQTGYLYYQGLVLTTAVDYEASFGIVNGANAPVDPNLVTDNDLFKENFLILIGTDYYAISEWDGQNIHLIGPPLDWGVSIGTAVQYKIYHFEKNAWSVPEKETGYPTNLSPTTIPSHNFDFIDRRGNEVYEIVTETSTGFSALALATPLNATKKGKNEMLDSINQKEFIEVRVETRNKEIHDAE